MKIQIYFVIGMMLIAAFISTLAQEQVKVLLLEMDTLRGATRGDALLLTAELSNAVSRIGNYDVFTKSSEELKKIFVEKGRTMPIFMDESSRKDLGIWLNADFVIGGTLGKTENNQFSINMEMIDVEIGRTVSTVQLSVRDFNHRLFLKRIAQLLIWGRLRISCDRSPYESFLEGRILSVDMKDPDYDVWLVEPNKTHTLEVKTSLENYSAYKESIILKIAETKVVEAKLKHQMGILNVQSIPEADVYLNDEMIGTTPLQKEIHEGEYMLTLTAARHNDLSKHITILSEDTTFVEDILSTSYATYRRNGIISAVASALFIGSGIYTSSEADKSYDQYLETMNTSEMSDRRNKAKTLDFVSYVSYGLAGAFAIWSVLEWIGLITADEPSEISSLSEDNHPIIFSFSNKGFVLTFRLVDL